MKGKKTYITAIIGLGIAILSMVYQSTTGTELIKPEMQNELMLCFVSAISVFLRAGVNK